MHRSICHKVKMSFLMQRSSSPFCILFLSPSWTSTIGLSFNRRQTVKIEPWHKFRTVVVKQCPEATPPSLFRATIFFFWADTSGLSAAQALKVKNMGKQGCALLWWFFLFLLLLSIPASPWLGNLPITQTVAQKACSINTTLQSNLKREVAVIDHFHSVFIFMNPTVDSRAIVTSCRQMPNTLNLVSQVVYHWCTEWKSWHSLSKPRLQRGSPALWSSLIKWTGLWNKLGFVDISPSLCREKKGHCQRLKTAKTQPAFHMLGGSCATLRWSWWPERSIMA